MKYIGITGITKISEIEYIKPLVSKNRLFMCGILVSYKILKGDNNSDRKRYVNVKDLHDLCKESHNAGFLTILHYNTKNKTEFYKEIAMIMDIYNLHDYVDGFQLNIDLPSHVGLTSLKDLFPSKKIIFSLNNTLITNADTKQLDLNFATNSNLNLYFNTKLASVYDYVLIDLSGGVGKFIDIDASINIYNMLKKSRYVNEIGFAGGLSDENVFEISEDISDKLNSTDFSIDAESNLRDSNDELNLKKVSQYFQHFPF